ncbi:MAG: TonB family protein [Phenylobacterium sp.]|nr:TonB family protein [Phenylobacterium sp.]
MGVGGSWMRRQTAALAALGLLACVPGASRAQQSLWVAEPSGQDVRASFPERALHEHINGEAVALCRHDRDGRLTDCKIQWETPAGYGFGAAVLSLAPKYRVRIEGSAQPPVEVALPMFFSAPGPVPPSREAAFQEAAGRFAWLAPAGPYWPEKALRMASGGRAGIDCRVTDDGRLSDCRPASDEPVSLGFLMVTMRMAERGWMTAGPKPAGATEPADGYWRFEVDFPAKDVCDEPGIPIRRSQCQEALRAQGYR